MSLSLVLVVVMTALCAVAAVLDSTPTYAAAAVVGAVAVAVAWTFESARLSFGRRSASLFLMRGERCACIMAHAAIRNRFGWVPAALTVSSYGPGDAETYADIVLTPRALVAPIARRVRRLRRFVTIGPKSGDTRRVTIGHGRRALDVYAWTTGRPRFLVVFGDRRAVLYVRHVWRFRRADGRAAGCACLDCCADLVRSRVKDLDAQHAHVRRLDDQLADLSWKLEETRNGLKLERAERRSLSQRVDGLDAADAAVRLEKLEARADVATAARHTEAAWTRAAIAQLATRADAAAACRNADVQRLDALILAESEAADAETKHRNAEAAALRESIARETAARIDGDQDARRAATRQVDDERAARIDARDYDTRARHAAAVKLAADLDALRRADADERAARLEAVQILARAALDAEARGAQLAARLEAKQATAPACLDDAATFTQTHNLEA